MSLRPVRAEGSSDWLVAAVCDHCTQAILPTEQAVALWDAHGDVLEAFHAPLTLHAPTCDLRIRLRLTSLQDWQSTPLLHFVAQLARAVHPCPPAPQAPVTSVEDLIRAIERDRGEG